MFSTKTARRSVPAITASDVEQAEQAFQRHLQSLAKAARNEGKRWSASHSKQARGELSGHWATRPETIQQSREILNLLELPDTYGLDVAASPVSAKAPEWYGPFHPDEARRDALDPRLPWHPEGPGASWLNPVYALVSKFARRAAEYVSPLDVAGRPAAPLMFLVFARTDTQWFHRSVVGKADFTWFREGRDKFIDPLTGGYASVAPAPSMLCLYGCGKTWRDSVDWTRVRRIGPWHLGRFA